MIIRVLILAGLIYLIYRGRKRWLEFKSSVQDVVEQMSAPQQVDDIMVQDPFCKVYFPQREGLHAKHKGEDLYFCSQECKDKYLTNNS